jgi:uncharacterized protein
LRKALKLLWQSSPSIVEWLQSPIVYIDDRIFSTAARQLIPQIYSVKKGIYHYRSIAKTTYRGHLREEIVPIKKYFYVLRSLLSIQWLQKYQQPSPVEFHRLREQFESNSPVNAEIELLLERKKNSLEKEMSPAARLLNDYIEMELEKLENFVVDDNEGNRDIESLNQLFAKIINVTYYPRS